MVETLVKAVSLNELSSKVRRAFYRMGFEEDCWFDGVEEVYEGYAIICMSYGEYYQAPYSITAEGEIMPSSPDLWLPVEKEWVAKNAVKYADRKVVFGSKVKALGDGKVGGYLVLFSSPNQPDLYGDYFDSETDFDIENGVKTSIYYNHGFDPVLQKRRLGKAAIGLDDVGVWIQGQLDLRDEYEQAVYKLVEMEKVGWSSGTASHLVEVEETGKTCHIKRWPLGLDASVTPTPADPRQIIPIKSLKSDTSLLSAVLPETAPEAGQHPAVLVANDADNVTPVKSAGTLASNSTHEDTIMPEVNTAAAATPTVTTAPIVAPAAEDRMAQFEARFKSMEDALSQFGAKFDIMLKSPAVADTGFDVPGQGRTPEQAAEAEAIKAFEHYARTGERTKGLKAAINEGTGSQGGYLVPTLYSNDLVVARRYLSILRAAGAKVVKVDGTNSFKIPTMTDSAAAVLTSEAGAFDEKEPTFGEVTAVPYKLTKLVKASDESLADSRIPIMEIAQQDATQAFAAAENSYFTTGTGSSQPQGVVTGGSLGVTAAGTAVITADEVIDLYHSLADLYRMNAVWMMNDATLKLVRKLKDTTNQYLWSPGLAEGEPSTILGRPVFINNSMATPATTAKTILFGDLSYFWIFDFAGIEMKRLDELYAGNGQIGFRWYSRIDSHVMLSAAIKYLAQA